MIVGQVYLGWEGGKSRKLLINRVMTQNKVFSTQTVILPETRRKLGFIDTPNYYTI